MPKKISKKLSLQKPLFSSPFVNFLLAGFLVAIILGVLSFSNFRSFCANSITCVKDLTGKYDSSSQTGEFMGQTVSVPSSFARAANQLTATRVLGETNGSNKHIYIDLAAQKIYAKEGEQTIYEFPISSGKWGRTPTGDFTIWIKLRYTRMSGGSKANGTYYNLPNVPYTMYFYNAQVPKYRGFGIHGAYWHNNFGTPMSHGCINMRTEEVEKIYNWALPESQSHTTYASDDNPGTPITIYGVAPNE